MTKKTYVKFAVGMVAASLLWPAQAATRPRSKQEQEKQDAAWTVQIRAANAACWREREAEKAINARWPTSNPPTNQEYLTAQKAVINCIGAYNLANPTYYEIEATAKYEADRKREKSDGARSSAPPSTSAPATAVSTRDEPAEVTARDNAEVGATPPKRKIGTLTRILMLGNSCISVRMLPYDPRETQALDYVELKNDCSAPQIITTYVENDERGASEFLYPHGPPYLRTWLGYGPPPLPFYVIPVVPFTMWPGNITTQTYLGGANITIKTAACNYYADNKVVNLLLIDGGLGGFSKMICIPNPGPPPPKPWP